MNFNLKKITLWCVSICAFLQAETITKSAKKLSVKPIAEKTMQAKATTAKTSPCLKPATIPYAQEFNAAQLPANQKELLTATWGNLYAGYLARNASTAQNSNEWLALKKQVFINNPFCEYTPLGQNPQQIQQLDICLDTPPSSYVPDCQTNIANAYKALTFNYLEVMQNYLTSPDFEKAMQVTPGADRQSTEIHKNYATIHLVKALSRLSETCSFSVGNEEPITNFNGDIRDLGIIVNITNNTDRSFYITDQYTSKNPIAFLKHGLNGVNLYTAGLYQTPTNQTENSLPPCFSFFEVAPASMAPTSNQPLFTIGIYSGAQLINFLKMLPRKDPNIFEMNGCPTSEEYLANPQDQYMVLIQNPTPKTATTRNLDQRIQAINLSVLTGPYLLTMQINETTDTQINPATKQPNNTKILQPALTTVQVIQKPVQKTTTTATSMQEGISNAADSTTSLEPNAQSQQAISGILDRSLLPLIILPDYLWNITNLQLFWMLYSTSYIAALTDFGCFGAGNFGNAFSYFDNLGYFSTDTEYRFIIDKYNLLQVGQTLFDASWLLECALYESSLEHCSDIPGIYSAQNSKGQMVANEVLFDYINFQIELNTPKIENATFAYFNKNQFNATYNIPYHQLRNLIFSLPASTIKNNVFLLIQEFQQNLYQVSLINKQNQTLNTQTIFLNFEFKNMQIKFFNTTKNWKGTTIQTDSNLKKATEFTLNYKQETDVHQLLAFPTTPIDKMQNLFPVKFSKLPLVNLYFDLFKKINVSKAQECPVFNDGILPPFLQNLSNSDWSSGVYLIPTIQNNEYTNNNNPRSFMVTFYKSDKKTVLGSVSNNNLTEPAYVYNLRSDQFPSILDVSLSTGILLKYQPI